ncbi:hypothetical protein ASZ90_004719 [hydrocarbon metagenome]|uniref:Uncharacterized protein n=1 Tax=hydrocarbon metagenome TaxID=938273 RepID=A0A0W8FXN6_9ZZZZ
MSMIQSIEEQRATAKAEKLYSYLNSLDIKDLLEIIPSRFYNDIRDYLLEVINNESLVSLDMDGDFIYKH